MNKKTVVIGMLGVKLDSQARTKDRWSIWRPTVSVCQHEDFLVDQIEILHTKRDQKLQRQVADDIQNVSPETQVNSHIYNVRDPWDFEEVYASLHDFARNYHFDLDKNEYLIHITTGTHVQQICWFLLTESRHFPGRLLQSSPPTKRDKRSPGRRSIIDLDLSRYDEIATRFSLEQKESYSYLKSGIETKNKPFNKLIERIEKVVVTTDSPILLSGPTGAGKSQLAKRIFELKKIRKLVSGDLVEVNCATLRGDQAMSTLFGHKKGAFTGAVTERKGLLKSANNGMLFLDEIGELGIDEQAMLLRAVEEKSFQPVGADEMTNSDFQLIAGTNRDLHKQVAKGKFREDLLARINLWDFRLPGLAQRREDIEPNLDYELEQFTSHTGRRLTINKEARSKFFKFAMSHEAIWSANFRDLNAAVTRMGTLANSGRISVKDVNDEIQRLKKSWSAGANRVNDVQSSKLLDELLDQGSGSIDHFDCVQLAEVVKVCRSASSLSDAGRKLFEVSRASKKTPNDADRLRKYLAKFGLDWQSIHGKK
ncbi:MAG: RNA repair transcriptional activator RtcR [Mariniblastus sp.]